MRADQPSRALTHALESMWSPLDSSRCRTLARLVQHRRQLEGWWKCELAAHLWDHVGSFGSDIYVWLESFDRADVALAAGTGTRGSLVPITSGAVCIPMELKTTGTWWGKSPSAIAKALSESGRKCLEQDMQDANGRREANPFAAVGLLVTHAGPAGDKVLVQYLESAKELGVKHQLECIIDHGIVLPEEDGQPTVAHQLFWSTR